MSLLSHKRRIMIVTYMRNKIAGHAMTVDLLFSVSFHDGHGLTILSTFMLHSEG